MLEPIAISNKNQFNFWEQKLSPNNEIEIKLLKLISNRNRAKKSKSELSTVNWLTVDKSTFGGKTKSERRNRHIITDFQ